MKVPIRRGGVYWIPDTAVQLPPTTPKDRVVHPRRPFLVMSTDKTNVDDQWPLVIGFPFSTSHEFSSEFDFELEKGDAGLKEGCWVRIPLFQPIAKEKLLERVGQLSASQMQSVVALHLHYIDAL